MFNPESYSVQKLLVVLIPFVILFCGTLFAVKSNLSRFLFAIFFGGFFFYSGIGSGFKNGVAENFAMYFIVFSTVFCTSFLFFSKTTDIINIDFEYINEKLDSYTKNRLVIRLILIVYISSFLFELVYPEIKLQRLISPPRPDILGSLRSRFDSESSTPFLVILVKYVRLLIYPFYLVFLVKFTKKIMAFFGLLFLPIYIEYCAHAYVGRSALLLMLLFLFLMLWKFRPEIRKRMLIVTSILLPTFIGFSLIYQVIRQRGAEFDESLDIGLAAEILLNTEVSFPTYSAEIVDQNHRVNLKDHFIWMSTIALPKFGLFEAEKGLAGYEISEILTKKKRTTPGFWIPLTGYLTECLYVYGKHFFWIPALVLGFLLSYLGKVLEKIPLLYGFALFLGLTFAYNLNRAGIGSALPLLLNNNLLMYLFFFSLIIKLKVVWLARTPKL